MNHDTAPLLEQIKMTPTDHKIDVYPRMCSQGEERFTSTRIKPRNGKSIRVETTDNGRQRLILDESSFTLKIDSYGYARYGGSVGRSKTKWGGVHSDNYTIAALNLSLKTALVTDSIISNTAGGNKDYGIFDVSEVVSTMKKIDEVTYDNQESHHCNKPIKSASYLQDALDRLLDGVYGKNTQVIYEQFWKALEKAANSNGTKDTGEKFDEKVGQIARKIAGKNHLKCLRNVNNQIKHVYDPRSKKHMWNHCNCTNFEPPPLDQMSIYIDTLRPLAADVILRRLRAYKPVYN